MRTRRVFCVKHFVFIIQTIPLLWEGANVSIRSVVGCSSVEYPGDGEAQYQCVGVLSLCLHLVCVRGLTGTETTELSGLTFYKSPHLLALLTCSCWIELIEKLIEVSSLNSDE